MWAKALQQKECDFQCDFEFDSSPAAHTPQSDNVVTLKNKNRGRKEHLILSLQFLQSFLYWAVISYFQSDEIHPEICYIYLYTNDPPITNIKSLFDIRVAQNFSHCWIAIVEETYSPCLARTAEHYYWMYSQKASNI